MTSYDPDAAWVRLTELGWQDIRYAPQNAPVTCIEAVSLGVHVAVWTPLTGSCGAWFSHDDEGWPMNPILFLPKKEEKAA